MVEVAVGNQQQLDRLQKALKLTDREWRATFDSISDAVWVLDKNSRIVKCNTATAELFGKDPADVIGCLCCEIVHQTCKPLDICPTLRLKHTLKRESMDFQYGERWFHITVDPILDEARDLIGIVHIMRDITEAKRHEERLRASQAMLSSIINSVPQSIFWKDANSVYLGCNEVFAKAVGISRPEDVVGKTDYDLPWPKEDAEAYRADDQDVMENDRPKRHIVEPLLQADGSKLLIDTTKVPLLDREGNTIGLLGVYDDITEQKKAEEELSESRAMLKLILDTIPVRVFWKDRRSVFLGCNRAFASDAGLASPDDIIGHTDYDMTWFDQAELYRADDKAVMESGEPKLNYHEAQTTPDGRTIWLQTTKIPIRDLTGQIVGMMGTYEDITEQVRAQEEVAARTDKLQAVVDAFPDIYMWLDEDRRIIGYHAHSVSDIYVPPEQFMGKRAQDFLPPEVGEKAAQAIEQAYLTGSPQSIIVELPMPGGTRTYESRVVVTPSGRVLVVTRDITELKRAEEEMRKSEERYRQLVEISPLPIAVSVRGRFVFVNAAALAMMGASRPEEVIGREVIDFVAPESREDAEARMISMMEGRANAVPPSEEKFLRMDQSQFDVEVTAVKMIYQGESAILAVIHDVTERKRAELTLWESTEKYRILFESANDAILLMERDRFTDCNQLALQMYGCTSKDQLVDRKPHEFSPPNQPDGTDSTEKALEKIDAALDGVPQAFEWLHSRLDGSLFDAEVRLHAVELQGRMVLQAIVRDVTERKRVEKKLLERQALVTSIYRAAPGGIGMVVNRVLTEVNDRICEMTGYTREELIGQSARILYPGQQEYNDVGKVKYEQIEMSGTGSIETTMRRKDGSTFDVLLSSTPLDTEDWSRGVTFNMLDITDRKRNEAEKRAFYRQTILSVTDGKLDICDKADIEPYVMSAESSVDVGSADDMAEARRMVEAKCTNNGLTGKRRDEFTIAAGEAITNAIKHGGRGRVYAGVSDGEVWVGISDCGSGIDSLILPNAVLRRGYSTKPSLGLGYSIMLEVADRLLLCTGSTGTTVILFKSIQEPSPISLGDVVDTWEGIESPG